MQSRLATTLFTSFIFGVGLMKGWAEPLQKATLTPKLIENIHFIDIEFDRGITAQSPERAFAALKRLYALEHSLERSFVSRQHLEALSRIADTDPAIYAEVEGLLMQLQQGHVRGSQRKELRIAPWQIHSEQMRFAGGQNAIVYARTADKDGVYLTILDAVTGAELCNTKRLRTGALCKWAPKSDQQVDVQVESAVDSPLELMLLTN